MSFSHTALYCSPSGLFVNARMPVDTCNDWTISIHFSSTPVEIAHLKCEVVPCRELESVALSLVESFAVEASPWELEIVALSLVESFAAEAFPWELEIVALSVEASPELVCSCREIFVFSSTHCITVASAWQVMYQADIGPYMPVSRWRIILPSFFIIL